MNAPPCSATLRVVVNGVLRRVKCGRVTHPEGFYASHKSLDGPLIVEWSDKDSDPAAPRPTVLPEEQEIDERIMWLAKKYANPDDPRFERFLEEFAREVIREHVR